MTKFETLKAELELAIEQTYTSGVSMQEAEMLAAKFLGAQMAVSAELQKIDLDARMRKSGTKAVRAAVYLAEASKGERKPTEAALAALVETTDIVQTEQDALDRAETEKAGLERIYDIFTNGHIYFRGIAKGSFQ